MALDDVYKLKTGHGCPESFDFWEFMGLWHPNYNCYEIGCSDDLQCFIDDETDNSQYDRLDEVFHGNKFLAEVEMTRINCEQMLKAIEEFQKSVRMPLY